MATWLATDIFGVKLTPLLATSAVFSLVLGLALQDTLGNLFAGVALQFDKPYEIGHWIEVSSGATKFIGQVHEISWRATLLTGVFDEDLVIPNRVIAQAEIANYSRSQKPIWRSQSYKIPYQYSMDLVRQVLLEAVSDVAGILQDPEPVVLIPESNENWMVIRCSYCITDYGAQWRLGSDVNESVISALKKNGMEVASQKIQILR
jgi:small-conductance mechanosensitive channel